MKWLPWSRWPGVAGLLLVAACGGCRSRSEPEPAWSYRIALLDKGLVAVHAIFRSKEVRELVIADGAAGALSGLRIGGQPRQESGPRWTVASDRAPLEVSYQLDLGAAGASRQAGSYLLRPASLLLRPAEASGDLAAELRATVPDALAAGLPERRGGAYGFTGAQLGQLPPVVLGAFWRQRLSVGGCEIEVVLRPGRLQLDASALRDWVKQRAEAVASYLGHMPVPRLLVVLTPRRRRGVSGGSTDGMGGAVIELRLGRAATDRDLEGDWRLVHELVHLVLPNVPRQHHWFEEGLATYLEPVVRAAAGELSVEDVWREWLTEMPRGQSGAGYRGLDRTGTWASTYWGGALYWLRVDLTLRQRGVAGGIGAALRGIQAAGGSIEVAWELARVLEAADSVAGTPVLQEIYRQMATSAERTDLPAMWRALGVALGPGGVTFDDRAPLAAVRRVMVEGPR